MSRHSAGQFVGKQALVASRCFSCALSVQECPKSGGDAVMGSGLGGSGSDCWSFRSCLFRFLHHTGVKGPVGGEFGLRKIMSEALLE